MKLKDKIILPILLIILITVAITLGYTHNKYNAILKENKNITKNIEEINNKILTTNSEYNNYTNELTTKKEELKDKIKEYEVWLRMIEQLK